ncbi:phosphatase PAP2 family protein [Xanthomonas hyacinthi]|uniref:Acid phosphatase n=1 Tax=Xanthomonas hyacinthi TaxID=56455 RepID=A0A2S7EXM4_9XANT|nr:phosphatase PAP2 family protein [Xanthomonas hyacinthi]KLD77343.1 phosphatase [Xanthomonas hyacinthi DSM 19077]PPU97897.1 phosphatase PAP2 family protein [Xanthomonas hyacinthi]QGY76571.1 phosphatase PAP2 family protein [Xanthomonas hyacinthi]
MSIPPAYRLRPAGCAMLVIAFAACSTPAAHAPVAPAPAPAPAPAGPGTAIGYLDAAAVPASLQLLPPPPAAGTPGEALDLAVNREALALRGSPRWQQAARDAALNFPAGANQFACALGIAVDARRTPHLYTLLERSRVDASATTRAAKKHYQRPRPFMLNLQPTCAPGDEDDLRRNGSYPSGHSTLGWTWALILSEATPNRADALIARGRNYGESRLVCNVHWQSDVLAGRFMGAALVARLHANPAFQADLQAARGEIARAQALGAAPQEDCATQTQVLKTRPASAL